MTLQLGQHPGPDLLGNSRQKPSLPAPPELLQPSQGNAFAFWSIPLLTMQIWIPLALPVAEKVFQSFRFTQLNLAGAYLSFEQQI